MSDSYKVPMTLRQRNIIDIWLRRDGDSADTMYLTIPAPDREHLRWLVTDFDEAAQEAADRAADAEPSEREVREERQRFLSDMRIDRTGG